MMEKVRPDGSNRRKAAKLVRIGERREIDNGAAIARFEHFMQVAGQPKARYIGSGMHACGSHGSTACRVQFHHRIDYGPHFPLR